MLSIDSSCCLMHSEPPLSLNQQVPASNPGAPNIAQKLRLDWQRCPAHRDAPRRYSFAHYSTPQFSLASDSHSARRPGDCAGVSGNFRQGSAGGARQALAGVAQKVSPETRSKTAPETRGKTGPEPRSKAGRDVPAKDREPEERTTSINRENLAVIDGDSVLIDGREWRLLGFDAPEFVEAKCEGEHRAGIFARRRLVELIAAARRIEMQLLGARSTTKIARSESLSGWPQRGLCNDCRRLHACLRRWRD